MGDQQNVKVLPILPLKNALLFPNLLMPLSVGRSTSLAAVKTALATEAMYLMARHVFEELGYRRYEWKCNALNQPSRRAAFSER